jgi:hypothetical protein
MSDEPRDIADLVIAELSTSDTYITCKQPEETDAEYVARINEMNKRIIVQMKIEDA